MTINDFIEDWKEESEATLKVFSKIPDNVLSIKDNVNVRTLGRLAWHITQTVTEMLNSCGITDEDPLANRDLPSNMREIKAHYEQHSVHLTEIINQKWTDETLTQPLTIYGQTWQGRKVLSILIKHQIHHRAQMTIVMRQHNLPVPGIYGPSKEEWSQYGMDAQE